MEPLNQQELEEKVLLALDEIRPYLLSDGGDISLVAIKEKSVVEVMLHGNCVNCSVNQMTLSNGVEATIKKHAPQIEKVINIS